MQPDQRAALAKQLQNNALLGDMLAELESTAITQWRSTTDPEKQREAWHDVRSVTRLRNWIRSATAEVPR